MSCCHMSALINFAVELVMPASINHLGSPCHSRVFSLWLLRIAIELLAAAISKKQLTGQCHVVCLHVMCYRLF